MKQSAKPARAGDYRPTEDPDFDDSAARFNAAVEAGKIDFDYIRSLLKKKRKT